MQEHQMETSVDGRVAQPGAEDPVARFTASASAAVSISILNVGIDHLREFWAERR